jgi:hypothetical protein
VATHTDLDWSLTTTEIDLTEGKHYWEVELLSESVIGILIGISRPTLNPAGDYSDSTCTEVWFMCADYGRLYGNGKQGDDAAGAYKQGDRVGVLLDLVNGSLRFFKNGVEHGSGYAAGSVTGPVVAVVQMGRGGSMADEDSSVRLLPNAEAPAGV